MPYHIYPAASFGTVVSAFNPVFFAVGILLVFVVFTVFFGGAAK